MHVFSTKIRETFPLKGLNSLGLVNSKSHFRFRILLHISHFWVSRLGFSGFLMFALLFIIRASPHLLYFTWLRFNGIYPTPFRIINLIHGLKGRVAMPLRIKVMSNVRQSVRFWQAGSRPTFVFITLKIGRAHV